MTPKIQTYINTHHLITPSDKVLMAVSGGRDSVCMASVLLKLGYQIAIAHCNFKLRGKDSDKDEQFVKDWAKAHNIACFTIRFDTLQYASEHKISTQMAARDLRYDWFERLSEEHQFTKIAIAHNSDDVAETFFINLIRGTGLDGLTGIKPIVGKIIRPLLSVSRDEIDRYIQENQIAYREDVTNASVKYLRNKIRHQVLPEFKSISVHFNQTLIENIAHLNDSKCIVDNEVERLRQKLFVSQNEQILIPIADLLNLDFLSAYLYELLKPYQFTKSVVQNLLDSLSGESGRQFYSDTHRIVKDRDYLILTNLETLERDEKYSIEESDLTIEKPLHLMFTNSTDKKIIPSASIAYLDKDKLQFPLTLRKWKAGDKFVPLGMSSQQKVSDFLINQKVSRIEKEQTYVLLSKEDIVWLVGHRINDRYKITEDTHYVFKIEIQKNDK